MNKSEKLEQEILDNDVTLHQADFSGTRIKGLYADGNIALARGLSEVEKSCVLAEELGHHHTSVGNILDMSDTQNRKQERQARLWAYDKQIGLTGLIKAYEANCQGLSEIAEYLEVTDAFLCEAIKCYTEKYGLGVSVNNYYIAFAPNLQILKLI